MKNIIIGVVVAIVVIVIGLYSCVGMYAKEHFKIGGTIGAFVIRDMATLNTMDECVAKVKSVLTSTPDMASSKEIPGKDGKTYTAVSEMKDGSEAMQRCMSRKPEGIGYVLMVKPAGK